MTCCGPSGISGNCGNCGTPGASASPGTSGTPGTSGLRWRSGPGRCARRGLRTGRASARARAPASPRGVGLRSDRAPRQASAGGDALGDRRVTAARAVPFRRVSRAGPGVPRRTVCPAPDRAARAPVGPCGANGPASRARSRASHAPVPDTLPHAPLRPLRRPGVRRAHPGRLRAPREAPRGSCASRRFPTAPDGSRVRASAPRSLVPPGSHTVLAPLATPAPLVHPGAPPAHEKKPPREPEPSGSGHLGGTFLRKRGADQPSSCVATARRASASSTPQLISCSVRTEGDWS